MPRAFAVSRYVDPAPQGAVAHKPSARAREIGGLLVHGLLYWGPIGLFAFAGFRLLSALAS